MRRCAALLCGCTLILASAHAQTDWPGFGHDPGSTKYSPLSQINADNVSKLQVAWKFDTMVAVAPPPAAAPVEHSDASADPMAPAQPNGAGASTPSQPRSRFTRPSESLPLVVNDVLYMSTGYQQVIALNAETGEKIWEYQSPHPPALRGVSYWPGTTGYGPAIVYGTLDGFLMALDAKTGTLIPTFGDGGMVNLRTGEVSPSYLRFAISSPPAIYKNYVIPGSSPGEQPAFGASSDVRAFDMRNGKLVWTFHTIPRPGELNHDVWKDGQWEQRAGANNWGFMTVDVERGIIFVPLGTPNKDFYGGDREGSNLYGTSIVALDANTGKLKWYFQTTHHDNWDWDDMAAPILVTVKHGRKTIPAVVQINKAGLVFILDRETGKPIYGVKEVPAANDNALPGDSNWPTQPMPIKPPPLARVSFTPDEIATVTPEHEAYCKNLLAMEGGALTGGPFAQYGPKLRVIFPSWTGGINWGGGAYDPKLGYIIIDSKDLANFNKMAPDGKGGYTRVPPDHAPPGLGDYFWDGQKKWPCQAPPWSHLTAINVNTGEFAWRVPFGSFEELDKLGVPQTGTPTTNAGGIATGGNLFFIGATMDGKFHAYDSRTGKVVWETDLGVNITSTPITWMGKNGKQYVAVFASGAPRKGAKPTILYAWTLPQS
jgi:quinoprotein glucose dehydrogenase